MTRECPAATMAKLAEQLPHPMQSRRRTNAKLKQVAQAKPKDGCWEAVPVSGEHSWRLQRRRLKGGSRAAQGCTGWEHATPAKPTAPHASRGAKTRLWWAGWGASLQGVCSGTAARSQGAPASTDSRRWVAILVCLSSIIEPLQAVKHWAMNKGEVRKQGAAGQEE